MYACFWFLCQLEASSGSFVDCEVLVSTKNLNALHTAIFNKHKKVVERYGGINGLMRTANVLNMDEG